MEQSSKTECRFEKENGKNWEKILLINKIKKFFAQFCKSIRIVD